MGSRDEDEAEGVENTSALHGVQQPVRNLLCATSNMFVFYFGTRFSSDSGRYSALCTDDSGWSAVKLSAME